MPGDFFSEKNNKSQNLGVHPFMFLLHRQRAGEGQPGEDSFPASPASCYNRILKAQARKVFPRKTLLQGLSIGSQKVKVQVA